MVAVVWTCAFIVILFMFVFAFCIPVHCELCPMHILEMGVCL